jgi:NodT family efflux transporter outer membrane factor (OMF) lipoprotein
MGDARSVAGALSVLSLLALAACSTATPAPGSERPLVGVSALPVLQAGAGAQQEAGLAIDRWWMLFDDPALAALIEQALRDNHDLVAAAARVREARARLDDVQGSRLPSLDFQELDGRSRQSADSGLPTGTPLTATRQQLQLVARYELDLWGRLSSSQDAARSRLLAQEWARASIAWSLSAQIAEAHFSLRAVQRQIALSTAARGTRATSLGLRQRERAAGIANEFDLRRAEAELASSDGTLATLQRQRLALEATLALLAGRPLASITLAEVEREPLDPSRPYAVRLPAGPAAERLLQRPDVRRAEAQLAAAQADIASARAATLPSISLSGSVGSDVRSMSNLFNAPGFVWSVASNFTQNLFDGGQGKARVTQADARADAALADYRQVVLAALTELREAYAALDVTQQTEQAAAARVRAMERAHQLARLGHASGAFGYLDLLDAERNHQQAQLDEVSARRDRLLGQVAALKALGGGGSAFGPIAFQQP